jgi:hypothetical protein
MIPVIIIELSCRFTVNGFALELLPGVAVKAQAMSVSECGLLRIFEAAHNALHTKCMHSMVNRAPKRTPCPGAT